MKDALQSSLGFTRMPIGVASVLIAAFLLLPIAIVISTSFTAGPFLTFPPEGFSTRWYGSIAHDSAWTSPLFTSIRVGLGATALATVTGTAAALGMRRLTVRGRWLSAALVAPVALPLLAYALGLYDLFTRVPVLANTTIPLALGQAVIAFPFVYVIVSAGLASVDARISAAAATLGARWPMVVWKVELPLIKVSLITAVLFAFSFSFDEVVVALLMAPPENPTLPVQMFRAARESISPELSAASTMVMLFALVVLTVGVLIERHAVGRQRRTA